MIQRLALVAGALLLATALLLWWRAAPHHSPAHGSGGHSRQQVTTLQWNQGQQVRFEIDLENRTASATDGTLLDLALRGHLTVTGLGLSGGNAVLRLAFEGELTRLEGSAASSDQQVTVSEALQAPGFAEYNPNGQWLSFRSLAGEVTLAHNVWQAVASTLQLTRSQSGAAHSAHWATEEKDSVGQYLAEYQVNGSEVSRQKQRYLSTNQGLADYSLMGATSRFTLEGNQLQALQARELLRVKSDALGLQAIETQFRLTLKLKSRKLVNSQDLSRFAGEDKTANQAAQQATLSEDKARDRARVGDRTFDSIMANLAGFERELPEKEKAREYNALAALLRLQPEKLITVEAHIRDGGPLSELLIDALRDAGLPEAQEILADLMAEPDRTPPQRAHLSRALSQVAHPTGDTVNALRRLQTDPVLGEQATLGLGSNLFRLRGTDSPLAREVLSELTQDLSQAETPSKQANLLVAFGNGGHPNTLATILPFTQSENPLLRQAAARGLRRIPGPEADMPLIALLSDEDTDVRTAAARAIRERISTPDLVHAVATRLPLEVAVAVRAVLVTIAERWSSLGSELCAPLQALAAQDESEEIRSSASIAFNRNCN